MNILTRNAIFKIYKKLELKDPCVQILDINKKTTKETEEYTIIIIADGENVMKAILTETINKLKFNKLKKYCIIQLKDYKCDIINKKLTCIINQINVISDHDEIIGNPKNINAAAILKVTYTMLI